MQLQPRHYELAVCCSTFRCVYGLVPPCLPVHYLCVCVCVRVCVLAIVVQSDVPPWLYMHVFFAVGIPKERALGTLVPR